MPIFPFLFINCLVGIVSRNSNSQWVALTPLRIKATSLLATVIEKIIFCPLGLWSINRPTVSQKVKNTYEIFRC